MKEQELQINNIPAVLWGEKENSIYIYVHGKMSSKEEARGFASKAIEKGYPVLSFDLPEHGDRKDENYPCMVWNGVHDLEMMGAYIQQNWNDICLYGSSLGAYFSLLAYKDLPIRKCLFLSPILDMERLLQNMMNRFNVSEETLKEKLEIPTPMGETLYWDYYCYVRDHPVNNWNVPTAILYGSEDNLIERGVVESFAKQFSCKENEYEALAADISRRAGIAYPHDNASELPFVLACDFMITTAEGMRQDDQGYPWICAVHG